MLREGESSSLLPSHSAEAPFDSDLVASNKLLQEALQAGHLYGCGLDVLNGEPEMSVNLNDEIHI